MNVAIQDLTPSALLAKIDEGTAPLVVDVRTRREFAEGHIPGAINVPLASLLLSGANVPGDRGNDVVLYCGRGPRARMAAAVLRRAGFQRVSFLDGHITAWRKAGLREET